MGTIKKPKNQHVDYNGNKVINATLVGGTSALQQALMDGDVVLEISPEAVDRDATAAAWVRTVTLRLKNADGDVLPVNRTFTAKASVDDTSAAGTASIASGDITFEDGVATIEVSGDAAAWDATETDTLTIADLEHLGYTIDGGTSVQTFV